MEKKIKDLAIIYMDGISPDLSLSEAWDVMIERGNKSVPVTGEQGEMLGMIGLDDITDAYMKKTFLECMKGHSLLLRNILNGIKGECLSEPKEIVDSDKLEFTKDRTTVPKEGLTLIYSPFEPAQVRRILIRCVPVCEIMVKENLVTVHEDDIVTNIIPMIRENEWLDFPVLDSTGKPVGMIFRDDILYKNAL